MTLKERKKEIKEERKEERNKIEGKTERKIRNHCILLTCLLRHFLQSQSIVAYRIKSFCLVPHGKKKKKVRSGSVQGFIQYSPGCIVLISIIRIIWGGGEIGLIPPRNQKKADCDRVTLPNP